MRCAGCSSRTACSSVRISSSSRMSWQISQQFKSHASLQSQHFPIRFSVRTLVGERSMEYAVVWFERRERYGATGVAANLIRTGEALIVQVKPETLRRNIHNRFARVHVASAKMVELLGRVGDRNDETTALLYAYGIKPCRYPRDIEWTRPDLEMRLDGREWSTASFDQAGTEDIDDAFSLLRRPHQ